MSMQNLKTFDWRSEKKLHIIPDTEKFLKFELFKESQKWTNIMNIL